MMCTGEDSQGSNSQSCSERPGWWIAGSPVDGGCQIIIRKVLSCTIVGNLFGECHALCTLQTSFVDFAKEYVHCSLYKRLHFTPLPNSILLQWQSMVVNSSLPPFLCNFLFKYYWTCSVILTARWTSGNNE